MSAMAREHKIKLFSTKAAAEYLGIGERWFRRMVEAGDIRIWSGSRWNNWRFTQEELDRVGSESVRVQDLGMKADTEKAKERDEAEEADD